MAVLFPLWQIERKEYDAICAYLGLTPNAELFGRLSTHLASAPFRFPCPEGFSRFLAELGMTRFRVARLDYFTKLWAPDHPIRHALNGVVALHECDATGYRELDATSTGRGVFPQLAGSVLGFVLRVALTVPWLGWQAIRYTLLMPFRPRASLAGRRVLITGTSRGLGMDIMLECLERGANVVGIVRDAESLARVRALLPAESPVLLLSADLARPGELVAALQAAQVRPASIDIAVLCAGVKDAGESALTLASLRKTFEVNCFSAAEFARWFTKQDAEPLPASVPSVHASIGKDPSSAPPGSGNRYEPRSLVLISSMGRWHGMRGSGGYNASKAALSIWGESLDMELRQSRDPRFAVTIVEPGMFESDMTQQTALTKLLFVSRRDVARRIVGGVLAGRRSIRPPAWFALLTWGVCLAGRGFRYRLFARVKASPKD
jgi:NAD(P)-dependent dehydrogenase (short-subunit alcohol dehydrogenase family)